MLEHDNIMFASSMSDSQPFVAMSCVSSHAILLLAALSTALRHASLVVKARNLLPVSSDTFSALGQPVLIYKEFWSRNLKSFADTK